MRLLEDLPIAPRTVQFLRQLGHDVARVSDLAPLTLPDADIVSLAIHKRRVVLSQDHDFSSRMLKKSSSGVLASLVHREAKMATGLAGYRIPEL
jgi:predicted nuclease of predicted toxin-antitoxin system